MKNFIKEITNSKTQNYLYKAVNIVLITLLISDVLYFTEWAESFYYSPSLVIAIIAIIVTIVHIAFARKFEFSIHIIPAFIAEIIGVYCVNVLYYYLTITTIFDSNDVVDGFIFFLIFASIIFVITKIMEKVNSILTSK